MDKFIEYLAAFLGLLVACLAVAIIWPAVVRILKFYRIISDKTPMEDQS